MLIRFLLLLGLPLHSLEPLQLLRRSLAGPDAPYEGEMLMETTHGARGRVQSLLIRRAPGGRYRREIVDRLGLPSVTIVSDGETEWVYDRRRGLAWKGEPADADHKLMDPDEEYALLLSNYDFRLAGASRVAGRPCRVLEVRSRQGGRLAQRLCVEERHALVLERRVYREDGAQSARMRFVRLDLPAKVSRADFDFSPPAGTRVQASRLRPDFMEIEEAAMATDMRPRPPSWLPPGYVFESVNLVPYRGATLLHYRYSDGIDVLSLFQCPERVRLRLGGTQAQRVRLKAVSARLGLAEGGKVLEWVDQDRFVLVGSVGAEALRRVADSIP